MKTMNLIKVITAFVTVVLTLIAFSNEAQVMHEEMVHQNNFELFKNLIKLVYIGLGVFLAIVCMLLAIKHHMKIYLALTFCVFWVAASIFRIIILAERSRNKEKTEEELHPRKEDVPYLYRVWYWWFHTIGGATCMFGIVVAIFSFLFIYFGMD